MERAWGGGGALANAASLSPPPPPPGRMDPFADTLQRLREAFSSGRTRPVEFRATQLKGLGRFLQENKQLLQEALAQDLRKVGGQGRSGRVPSSVRAYLADPSLACSPARQAFYSLTSANLGGRFDCSPHVTARETEAHGG